MGYKWPVGIKEVPQIQSINGNEISFKDGTKKTFGAILFCTGYKHSFPFLSDNLRLEATNILYPDNLYKGVVFKRNKKLLYLGMQDQWFTFSMFDVQAWLARDYIMGKLAIPEDMEGDIKKWYDAGQ